MRHKWPKNIPLAGKQYLECQRCGATLIIYPSGSKAYVVNDRTTGTTPPCTPQEKKEKQKAKNSARPPAVYDNETKQYPYYIARL